MFLNFYKILTILLFFFISAAYGASERDIVDKYKVQNIKTLLQRSTWPNSNGNNNIVCVMGSHEKHRYFDHLNIKNRTFSSQVKYNVKEKDFLECQILYISYNIYKSDPKILDRLRGKPILTIGEQDMAWHGAILSLYKKRNRVHFSVNIEALKKSKISLYSGILEMAHLIED